MTENSFVHRDIAEKSESLPRRPGVYLFKDRRGEVIYVGKALSLRDRVRSYVRPQENLSGKVRLLMADAAGIDHIVTDTEVEALILECNLIKKHRPRYNVRLRDDKTYPYLKVSMGEEWPRVLTTRALGEDGGSRYFGPYTRPAELKETLHTLRRVLPFRTCSDARFRQHRTRPCLHYHIGRCLGPCAALCTPEEYRGMIEQLLLLLEGRQGEVVEGLRRAMTAAAERMEFEKAAELRDKLRALAHLTERQKVASDRLDDADVVGLAIGSGPNSGQACAQVFFMREGKLVGREAYLLDETAGEEAGEIMAAFLKQHYSAPVPVPAEILLSAEPTDAAAIREWFSGLRKGAVRLRVPRRGEKRRLLEMVETNARLFLEESARGGEPVALAELRDVLGLAEWPRRIECYDISNIQGRYAVGAMAVFIEGRPARNEYRRYKIRTVAGPDDYAMIREVLERRFRRDAGNAEKGASPSPPPELLLIDGGRGQLSAAREVLVRLGLAEVPAFGLAKENEWLFAAGRSEPIVLPRRSPALRLLQELRDEAHRFAVGYHRRLRSSESLRSILDEIPGIGPVRRRALLARFPSLQALRRAGLEEIAAVPGMTRTAAAEVMAHLKGEAGRDGRET